MAPLIALLAKAGLPLLANVLMSKGKEVLEEKLGVDIESLSRTEGGLIKLKELELTHEQFLLTHANQQAELDLAGFKIEVADRESARTRDAQFLKAGRYNYRGDFMLFLALFMIAALVWVVWKTPGIDEFVKGIFTLVLGRFLGYLDNIYNFEFGTTRGSRAKDDTIDNLSRSDK